MQLKSVDSKPWCSIAQPFFSTWNKVQLKYMSIAPNKEPYCLLGNRKPSTDSTHTVMPSHRRLVSPMGSRRRKNIPNLKTTDSHNKISNFKLQTWVKLLGRHKQQLIILLWDIYSRPNKLHTEKNALALVLTHYYQWCWRRTQMSKQLITKLLHWDRWGEEGRLLTYGGSLIYMHFNVVHVPSVLYCSEPLDG